MQTLSCLQRSSNDDRTLRHLLVLLLILFYEPLTTLYIYLPALVGYGAWRMFYSIYLMERVLWFFYLYVFEIDHSMPRFSIIFATMIYLYFMKRLTSILACNRTMPLIAIAVFYLLYIFVLLFYKYILDFDILIDLKLFVGYILGDILVWYAV